MKSSRYLFGILFSLAFMTALIVFALPVGPGHSKITSYFTTPEGNVHYSQVPEGINITAYVIVNNARTNAYDLINYSFKIAVWADLLLITDPEIISQIWIQNFTVVAGSIKTVKLTFNTSIKETYPAATLKEFYIKVEWGTGPTFQESHRLSGLTIGLTYEEVPYFTMRRLMIFFMAIGMGAVILLLILAAKKDFQRYLNKRRPKRPPTIPLPPPPEQVSAPPSEIPSISLPAIPIEPPPTERMELIPCPSCGSKIDATQIICPNCGQELPKCVICNLIIQDDNSIETCPECGAIGHKAHFREWVHVKGFCPICKKNLTF
ncbi:MAG: zinc ribbon domain-containing protein [Promethearchaeota archaeon]